MTALTLDQLTKTYPGAGQAAVHGLGLVVESGKLTSLLGPSGSGKTTTMKLIAGLIAPDAGDIRLGDRSVRDLAPERRGVAMVFQNPLLFPHLTVAGNVGFGLKMRGLPADQIRSSVAGMLDRVRLTGLADRRPGDLSGGQQQRVALARALILRPEVLLLDEPLSSLDPGLRDEMRQLIRKLQRETGITTLVVTHDQAEAVALSDRIALLLDGRLAQHDTPEAFYRRPATKAVARFFGGTNFIPGTLRARVFDGSIGSLALDADVLDPGVLEPGTLEPGTPDPGTLAPGTLPGGTVAPSTLAPGTSAPSTPDPGNLDPGTPAPSTLDPGTPDAGILAAGTPAPGTPPFGALDPSTLHQSNLRPDTLDAGTLTSGTLPPGTFSPGIPSANALAPGISSSPGIVTIRPEALVLGPGPNSRIARVEAVSFLGTQSRVDLSIAGLALQALTSPDMARTLLPGTDTLISLPPDALWVLPSAD